MDFNSIVANALGSGVLPPESRICNDQYVGRLDELSNYPNDFPVRSAVESRPEGLKCLIMVLESPHVEEYEGPNSPCPANGATGRNIRKHILRVKGLADFSEYGLIILNAVQYQCSMGVNPPGTKKDKVFYEAWENGGGKADFTERLEYAYKDEDQVVVCCTKGKLQGIELRRLVASGLTRCRSSFLGRTHPSSWERRGRIKRQNLNYEWS